jgi:adenosylcobyric acid synthase
MTGAAVMVCGTASDVGKSHIVTGLCRLLARAGVRVAPFKAQNMALNSYVTRDGHEIGRAQAAQAMAAGVEPDVAMNPVLLKPTGPMSSQVVVMGQPLAELGYHDYRARAPELRTVVRAALCDLRSRYDVVVCEGAGGAAEINLLDDDLVNLPLAADAGIPVIIVGDIERGGVFASLYGTVALLPPRYRALVRGLVVNKMRGDAALLGPGLDELSRRTGVPVLGVLPWLDGVGIDAEDSLALARAEPAAPPGTAGDVLDVAVVRFPHVANVTDVDPLRLQPGVEVRLTTSAVGDPDLLVLPGTKSTVRDLAWARGRGLDRAVVAASARSVVLGICGGYQMLGTSIDDGVESGQGRVPGLGMLAATTRFEPTKVLRRRTGSALGAPVHGYQVHHGRVRSEHGWVHLDGPDEHEGARSGNVFGTSLHGMFEADGFRHAFLSEVARARGKAWAGTPYSFAAARTAQHDRLADALDAHVDLSGLLGELRVVPA